MASKHSEQSKCERAAMASAGVGMCGGLLRRALTFAFGGGSQSAYRSVTGRPDRVVAAAGSPRLPASQIGRQIG